MNELGELLDINQAALFLQVSVTSLRRWTDEGLLSCLRVGGRRERRFRRSDLVSFMENQPARNGKGGAEARVPHTQDTMIGGVPVAYGSHFAALYSSDKGRARLSVAFLADGLRPGTTNFLVTAPKNRDAVLALLKEEDAEPEARVVLGAYAKSVHEQLDYWESEFVAAMRAGAHTLRVVGDVWGLAEGTPPEALQEYEAEYERRIAKRFPVVTMCLYDVRRFSGEQILGALRGHGDVFRYPVERLLD